MIADVAAVVIGCIVMLTPACKKSEGRLDNPSQCGLVVKGKLYGQDGELHPAYTIYKCIGRHTS